MQEPTVGTFPWGLFVVSKGRRQNRPPAATYCGSKVVRTRFERKRVGRKSMQKPLSAIHLQSLDTRRRVVCSTHSRQSTGRRMHNTHTPRHTRRCTHLRVGRKRMQDPLSAIHLQRQRFVTHTYTQT